MKTNAKLLPLLALLVLFVCSGSQCPIQRGPIYVAPPQVLGTTPTLPQLIEVVNTNSSKVVSLQSNQATVAVAGLPGLNANVAIGSTRQMRLKAGTGLTGDEIDLGSNNELFWLWVKRNQPPGVYFCRHDQFERSAARQLMPVRPEWVVSALGVVRLDPAAPHELRVASNGNLEIHTTIVDGQESFRRVTVLEPNAGWVVEQHMFTSQGTLIASAFNSQHVPDPATGAVLPRSTTIKWPRTGMEFTLTMHSLQINPVGLNEQLFQMPSIDGYQQIDLGVPGASPLGIPPAAQTGYSPTPPPPIQQATYVQPAGYSPAPPAHAPQPTYPPPPAYQPPSAYQPASSSGASLQPNSWR